MGCLQFDTCLVNSEGVLQGLLQCVNNVEFMYRICLYAHGIHKKSPIYSTRPSVMSMFGWGFVAQRDQHDQPT